MKEKSLYEEDYRDMDEPQEWDEDELDAYANLIEYDDVCPDGTLDDFWLSVWEVKRPSLEGRHKNKGD